MVIVSGPVNPIARLSNDLEAVFETSSQCRYGGEKGNCFASQHHFIEYLPPLAANGNYFTQGRLSSRTLEAELWLLANLPEDVTVEVKEDPT